MSVAVYALVVGGYLFMTEGCGFYGDPSFITEKGVSPPATIVMSDRNGKEICRYKSTSLRPCDHCPETGEPVS